MTAGFDGPAFASSLPYSALALVVVIIGTAVCARVAGRYNVIDVAWGLFYVAIAVASFASSAGQGDLTRRLLLLAMTAVWGLRLAIHIGRRSIGKGEDPRYTEMLADRGPVQVMLLVFGLQGVLSFLVSAPIQVGSFTGAKITPLAVVGVLVWAVGVFFETVGDWQMERFKSDPAHKGQVMDRGLWRYTRHPNYFGDACVWVGIYLVAAERWPGVVTVFAPVIMIYLLAFGSGKRLLERSMSQRPGYADYMRRTSGFVPFPPRNR